MRRHVIPCLLITGLVVGCGHPRAPQAIHETSSYPARPEKLVRVDVGSVDVEARVAEGDHIRVEIEPRGSGPAPPRRAGPGSERHRAGGRGHREDPAHPHVDPAPRPVPGHLPRDPLAWSASASRRPAVSRSPRPPATCCSPAPPPWPGRSASPRPRATSGWTGASRRCRYAPRRETAAWTGHPCSRSSSKAPPVSCACSQAPHGLIVETTSGDVTADELTGAASVNTSSGEVRATWSRLGPGEKIVIAAESGRRRRAPAGGSRPARQARERLRADPLRLRGHRGPARLPARRRRRGEPGHRHHRVGGHPAALHLAGEGRAPRRRDRGGTYPQAVPAPPEAPVVPRPPVERTPGAV